MNKKIKANFPGGSEWRKWDPHTHTKGTLKNDQFKSKSFEDFCKIFFRKAIENEIEAIGITDYFSIDSYKQIKQYVNNIDSYITYSDEEKEKIKNIFLFPNIELRILPVTGSGEMVNIHVIVNPDYVPSIENDLFNSIDTDSGTNRPYKMNKQGITALGKSIDADLNDEEAYKKGIYEYYLTHKDLKKLMENKEFKENVLIAVSNSSRDGASGFQEHYKFFEDAKESSLNAARRSIYCISNCIFSSNKKDIDYFCGNGKDSEKEVIKKCGSLKPCIHGSDAHIEDKLFSPDNDRFCWIKADLSFEGLKQILYEPKSGERVFIGPIKPDTKDSFKVIRRIKFHGTNDFPETIEFNGNLNSIIGSRSSGKSALLAYIAYCIDEKQAKELKEYGPGEGYPWKNINFECQVEWFNGKNCKDSPGNIIYIPQNHLYRISKEKKEIKEKIKPVLFNRIPEFESKYLGTERANAFLNEEISTLVNSWFEQKQALDELVRSIKELGSEKSIQLEIRKVNEKVKLIKEKVKINRTELSKFKKISGDISQMKSRKLIIDKELSQISSQNDENEYFRTIEIELIPSVRNLPSELQKRVVSLVNKTKDSMLIKANGLVKSYKDAITDEGNKIEENINSIELENRELINKHKKYSELEGLVTLLNKYQQTISEISILNKEKIKISSQLEEIQTKIINAINERNKNFEELKIFLDRVDQSTFDKITFSIEFDLDSDEKDKVVQKINMRETTRFVKKNELLINEIRKKPDIFLNSIYSGRQKINAGNDKLLVAKSALTLIEEILISAQMEGDRIGGISETTMTPGKRALFALRLILDESKDTWPLLIDQPEDDLDSRSIYDEIVPFLKNKKKERQIIMVSHNANLVIGADSETIIVANRNGEDRKNLDGREFNYFTGGIENTKSKDSSCKDTLLSQGIREHACQILEGGEKAFEHRINKFHFSRQQ